MLLITRPRVAGPERGGALRAGWRLQQLAVRQVAEIEIPVATFSSDVIGASNDGLRLERLEWQVRRGFSLHGGSHRGFQIHLHHWN